MTAVLVYGVALLAAVLVSGLAHRSILSTAVLFLAVGLVAGNAGIGLIEPNDRSLRLVAELALFAVLFTDALRVPPRELRTSWELPARALVIGMPLTFVATAALAWALTGLRPVPALLLAAVLTPTDPVFASAIVGREEVPYRVRHLLNVESGLNDGLALPVVIVLVDIAADRPVEPATLAAEAVGGVALGAAAGLASGWLLSRRWAAVADAYQPLATIALAITVLGAAQVTGANEFLAAFAAGIAIAAVRARAPTEWADAGARNGMSTEADEVIAELLKLAALLVFGALLSRDFLAGFGAGDFAFVVATLVLARPAALAAALWRSGLTRAEWLTTAWFGPKGFASVVYALLVLDAALPSGDELFHLAGAVVVLSIVAHSSTDVTIAHRFARAAAREAAAGEAETAGGGA